MTIVLKKLLYFVQISLLKRRFRTCSRFLIHSYLDIIWIGLSAYWCSKSISKIICEDMTPKSSFIHSRGKRWPIRSSILSRTFELSIFLIELSLECILPKKDEQFWLKISRSYLGKFPFYKSPTQLSQFCIYFLIF